MYSFNSTTTPPRSPRIVSQSMSPIRKEILEKQRVTQSQGNAIWGSINLFLLAILAYDVWSGFNECNFNHKSIYFIECFLAFIFFSNTIYHFFKYYKNSSPSTSCPTSASSFRLPEDNMSSSFHSSFLDNSRNCPNDSNVIYQNVVLNRITPKPEPHRTNERAYGWLQTSASQILNKMPWSPHRNTSQVSPSYKSSPILPANLSSMQVEDEHSLSQYLKEYDALETSHNTHISEQSTNLLSCFWNHPTTKIKDNSSMLRRCQYQLSTTSSPLSTSPKSDDKTSSMNQNQCSETWKRLNVDSVALIQWTENLRVWISQTILSRLIVEFDLIDKRLHEQGLTDVTIGQVGLDRLRKTAQGVVLQNTPNLPTIVPFLELHANQEYLVRRIRELSKGGCMSEYKWNGGGRHAGKEWDNTLPTDAAIIMHMLASYLDAQLVPLPNNPDQRPFSGCHFFRAGEKVTPNAKTLAVHEMSVHPPHYCVTIEEASYEMVKGYNNLFHSVLLFLYHVNHREHGMLGRVNLGRSGLNMLWIINVD